MGTKISRTTTLLNTTPNSFPGIEVKFLLMCPDVFDVLKQHCWVNFQLLFLAFTGITVKFLPLFSDVFNAAR